MHENLRFVWITGVALKEQLGGDAPIDHELMLVILRRYCQAGQEADGRIAIPNLEAPT